MAVSGWTPSPALVKPYWILKLQSWYTPSKSTLKIQSQVHTKLRSLFLLSVGACCLTQVFQGFTSPQILDILQYFWMMEMDIELYHPTG